MKQVRAVVLILSGVLMGLSTAIFIYDNGGPVQLKFLQWQISEPLPLWLFGLVCALVGAVVPRVVFWGLFWERFKETWTLKRKVTALEKELLSLRNMPLDDLPTLTEPARAPAGQQLQRGGPRRAPGRASAGDPAEKSAYDDFLRHGEGSDEVRAVEQGLGEPELLPPREAEAQDDPYAAAFDAEDPALGSLDDAQIYVSVRDSSSPRGEG